MSKEDLLNTALEIAEDEGFSGKDALIQYAASWPQWRNLSENKDFVLFHDSLSEKETLVIKALIQQGHAFQHASGYYAKDFWASSALTHALVNHQEEVKRVSEKKLKAKVEYLTSEKGYETPSDYAAIEIAWRPHGHRKNGFVAHHEYLSELDRDVLKLLRIQGQILPEQETGRYRHDYIAAGQLRDELQQMQAALEEVIPKSFQR